MPVFVIEYTELVKHYWSRTMTAETRTLAEVDFLAEIQGVEPDNITVQNVFMEGYELGS